MKRLLTEFLNSDSAAVTVDWVVLSAALVGLAVGVILIFNDGTRNVASSISEIIGEREIQTSFEDM